MKKYILFLIFCSCSGYIEDNNYYDFDVPVPEANTILEINRYVYDNVKYITDNEKYNKDEYWQTPEETWITKSGDCEDYVLLMIYLIYKRFNIESSMLIIEYRNYQHAICEVNGVYYDPTNNDYSTNLLHFGKSINLIEYKKAISYSIYNF